jgi:PAS domain S-box-containing protein
VLIAQAQAYARERAARAEAEASLARLRESQARLQRWEQLFTHLGVGVVLVRDPGDLIEDVNPAFARMHGYSREELMGRPLSDTLAPEARGVLARHAAAARSKPHHEYEAMHQRRDGSRFPALTHVSALRDAQGGVTLRAGTVMDITPRRAAELERQRLLATIEAERARLAAVLDQMPAGVIIAEAPSGRLVLGNRQVELLLGQPFHAANDVAEYGLSYRGFHPDGRPYAPEEWPMTRSLLHGEVVTGEEIEMERGDGGRAIMLASSAPIRDREGNIVAAVLAFLDVTERRRVEEAALQAARFGERLIAIVSHDLRNPLNAINLSATQLLHSEALQAREQRAVARISKAAERMRRMIAELLDFTRGRLGGGIPIQLEPLDWRQVVRQCVEELEAAWPERTLRLTVGAGTFQGRGDADRLAQVVSNLGGNALQYSPPETPVTFNLLEVGEDVVLEVHNPGEPIPPDALPHLFDPFRRARSETGSGGLGLGLYIVEQVVKGHGGHIEVTSTAEAGTTFRVTLPRLPPG